MLKEDNYYIMKASDGTVWNFTYNKNKGIVCRILKENQWSNYNVLINECDKKFQVAMLSNETIYVFYKDLSGNIKLKIHDKTKWREGQIIQSIKNDIYEGNFNITAFKDEIHIVYHILNKKNNKKVLFYQRLKDKIELSTPEIIDMIYPDNDIPIGTQITSNNELYIFYGKLREKYEVGYKILNLESGAWSDFCLIDKSDENFKENSFTFINNTIYAVPLKKDFNIGEVYKNNLPYEKILIEKEKLIMKLNYQLQEQKTKNLANESTLNQIRDDCKKFKENKNLLNESINLLQERLIEEGNKNSMLENNIIEKEREILQLKEEINNLQEKINILNSPLKSFLSEKILNKKIE